MSKVTTALMVLFTSLVSCAGESSNTNPPATPADGVDFKYNAPDDDEKPKAKDESSEADSKLAESSKSESSSSKLNKSESTEASDAPNKRCPTLTTKSKCEIALGCAWHTDKKCVAQ